MLKEELTGSVLSLLPLAGDTVRSALEPALVECPCPRSVVCPLTPQPPVPPQISLLTLFPAGENLMSLFLGSTHQHLSYKRQERTRGKPQEGMTGKPRECSIKPSTLTQSVPAVVLGISSFCTGGKEVRD